MFNLNTEKIKIEGQALTFEESLSLYFMAFDRNVLASDDVKHKIHCVFQTENFKYNDEIISDAVNKVEDELTSVL